MVATVAVASVPPWPASPAVPMELMLRAKLLIWLWLPFSAAIRLLSILPAILMLNSNVFIVRHSSATSLFSSIKSRTGIFQIEVHARPCHRGQPDSRFPQGLGSALYPKKSASFTAFFSFSSSYRGSVVKNSSGIPVAMAAITQEYR